MTYNPLDQPIDYFKLEGEKSPGISRVAGHGPPRKWEERNGYGLSGSTLVYLGNGLAKWKTETELWTAEDWQEWNRFKRLLTPSKPGLYAKAQDFWHPFTAERGVKSAVLVVDTMPRQVSPGVWLIELEWLQYQRPKLALQKPEGSSAQEKPDPVDEYINALVAQVEELAQ